MHLRMSSAEVVSCIYLKTLLTNLGVHANILDTDHTDPVQQEQPDLGLHCLTQAVSKRYQQAIKADFCSDRHLDGKTLFLKCSTIKVCLSVFDSLNVFGSYFHAP